jgi:hypothetical protein
LLLIAPCIKRNRVSYGWRESANTTYCVGLAIRLYYETHGRLPPAVVCDPTGRPLYSWRVLVLPYAEEGSLYRQFRLDEPWDSPHNLPLAKTTPRCYSPLGGRWIEPGMTRVQVFTGPGTAFERPGLTWEDFPDGLGNTALVVEAGEPVPWSKPGDVAYDPARPLSNLGSGLEKPAMFWCYEVGRHPGFSVCLADGTIRLVRASTEESLLRALFTRNGGEPFAASQLR